MHITKSIEIDINEDLTYPKIIYLEYLLDEVDHIKVTILLKKYYKIFAFNYHNMTGMDPNVVVHNIITHLDANTIKQKPHRVNPIQSLQIKDEIWKLINAKFIYPIYYS